MRRTLRVLPDVEAEPRSAAAGIPSLTLTSEKKPGRSQALMASLITLSWNQVVGFLTDWEELRRLAA
jgi:hypothetical protein